MLRNLATTLKSDIDMAISYDNMNMAAAKTGVLIGIYATLAVEDFSAVTRAYDFSGMDLTDRMVVLGITDAIMVDLSSLV